ncbi:MAG TPA: hypothetical protein VGK97_03745 [Spongiibacteraceae bacterium]
MIFSWQKLRFASLALLGASYLCIGYLISVSAHPPLAAVVIGIAPVIAAGVIAAWKSNIKFIALVACGVILAALYFFSDFLRNHIAWFYFLQHAGTMALLGATFGSTLSSDESALCSRIAGLLNKTALDAAYLKYTWKVTAAWTLYFIVSAILSVALFFLSSVQIWSLFATVLTPVFIGALFIGEYLVRIRALPDRKHFSIAETIQAYRNHPRG